MKPRSLFLVGACGALALSIGCGGSSGSKAAAAPTGKAAVRVAGLSSYHSLAAGMAFPNAVLRLTAPSGSGIGADPVLPKAIASMVGKARTKALASKGATTRAGDLDYSDLLGLYDDFEMTAANTATFTFYSDAAGTAKVGTMTIKTSGDTLVPTTFPATVDASVDLTAGTLPMKGSCEIVVAGGTGQNTLKGSLALTKDDLSFTVDMTLSDALAVGGSVSIKGHGQTITATNISGTLDQTLTCDASVEPGGATGTGTLSFLDGTIALTLKTAEGTSTAGISSVNGSLVFTYPDGTTETISSPLTAPVTSTGTVSGGGSTNGGGTSGGGSSLPYNAPVSFGGSDAFFTTYASNGNLVGSDGSTGSIVPSYLTSPTGSTQPVNFGSYTGYFDQGYVNGLSGGGAMVGYAVDNNVVGQYFHPLYWSSLNAAPAELPLPANYPSGRRGGSAISASPGLQIVGYVDFGTTTQQFVAAYWASPTTAPVKLKGTDGSDAAGLAGVAATDSGTILGQRDGISTGGSTRQWVVWTSPSANAIALDKANFPINPVTTLFMSKSGVVAGVGSDGLPYVWAPPSYAPVALKIPSGDKNVTIAGINAGGEIVGQSENANLLLWTSPTAAPTDLSALLSFYLKVGGIDDAGTIVVYDQTSGSKPYALSPK